MWAYLMVLETEAKLSIQSQKHGPCLPRESVLSHLIFPFLWDKGIDVPECLPGVNTVPPSGLDTIPPSV